MPETVFFKNTRKQRKFGVRSVNVTREGKRKNQEHDDLEIVIKGEKEARALPNKKEKEFKPDQSAISFSKGEAYREFDLPQGKNLHINFCHDIAISPVINN